MHELLIRAEQHQRGRRKKIAVALSFSALGAVLLTLASTTQAPAAAPGLNTDPLTTSSLPTPQNPHEIRLYEAQGGTEQLELSAKLDSEGGLITLPIAWTIRHAIAGSLRTGEVVHREEGATVTIPVVPGDYIVEAEYGLSRHAQTITVLPNRHTSATLIFNVGAIRALSRVLNNGLPKSLKVKHKIYALSGLDKGRQIVESGIQGEVFRVSAGTYRIESTFFPGNTIAQSQVKVRAGYLTGLQIDHKAGLAEIRVQQAASKPARITITDVQNNWKYEAAGSTSLLALAEGRYRAHATSGHLSDEITFVVRKGAKTIVQLTPVRK